MLGAENHAQSTNMENSLESVSTNYDGCKLTEAISKFVLLTHYSLDLATVEQLLRLGWP